MKNIDKEYTKKILNLYRDIDIEQTRPQMAGYHLVDFEGEKYYSSTDCHRLILIPKSNFELELNDHPKAVNISDVMISSEKFNLFISIDPLRIMELCKEINLVNELIDCPSCDGEGEFEHYGHSYECEHCDGTGNVESKNMVRNSDYIIQFENTTIANDFAYDLARLSAEIEEPTITLLYSTKQQAVFKIGDMLTLLMAKGPQKENTILKY